MHYTRYSEARRRLKDSVIRFDGEPVFVQRLAFSRNGNNPAENVRDEVALLEQAKQDARDLPFGTIVGMKMVFDPTDDNFWQAFLDQNQDADPQYRFAWENYPMRGIREHINRNRDRFNDYFMTEANYARRSWLQNRKAELGIGGGHDQLGDPVPREDNRVPTNTIWLDVRPINIRNTQQNLVCQTDERLNLKPPKLGMINLNGSTVFGERLPVNRYSQGLTSENFRASDIRTGQSLRLGLSRFPELVKTIKGEYPTLTEALQRIAGGDAEVVAFDRNMAVELDHRLGLAFLFYKKQKIGYTDNAERFNVGPSFRFLREELESKGVQVQ